MATQGYGMYGYNVLNVNGETDSLPFSRLSGITSQGGTPSVQFDTSDADEYGMSFPNKGGTYSAVRTPVSGVYEIEYAVLAVAGAAAGTSEVILAVDKQAAFDSSGVYSALNDPISSYQADVNRVYLAAASSTSSHTLRKTLFLERDSYVALYHTTRSGTATALPNLLVAYLLVRCVSSENSNKTPYQTA